MQDVLSVIPQPCLIPTAGNLLASFWMTSGERGAAPVLNCLMCLRSYCCTSGSLINRMRMACQSCMLDVVAETIIVEETHVGQAIAPRFGT